MKLIKKITNPQKLKSFISVLIIFFSMNNIKVLGSENRLGFPKIRIDQNEFEDKFFHNSIIFSEYDNLESQLKILFGRDIIDRSENTFYPDLSIIRVSDSLREMYRYKLNDMATSEIIYNINK